MLIYLTRKGMIHPYCSFDNRILFGLHVVIFNKRVIKCIPVNFVRNMRRKIDFHKLVTVMKDEELKRKEKKCGKECSSSHTVMKLFHTSITPQY